MTISDYVELLEQLNDKLIHEVGEANLSLETNGYVVFISVYPSESNGGITLWSGEIGQELTAADLRDRIRELSQQLWLTQGAITETLNEVTLDAS